MAGTEKQKRRHTQRWFRKRRDPRGVRGGREGRAGLLSSESRGGRGDGSARWRAWRAAAAGVAALSGRCTVNHGGGLALRASCVRACRRQQSAAAEDVAGTETGELGHAATWRDARATSSVVEGGECGGGEREYGCERVCVMVVVVGAGGRWRGRLLWS